MTCSMQMVNRILVVFILSLWFGTSPALGVVCGETIFVDTVLDRNLVDCPGNGIIIGADNIELRLSGFIVDGDGMGLDAGILLVDRVKVKIKGPGIIREFHEGILLDGGERNEVQDVTVGDNVLRGVHALNSSKNKIKENTTHRNGFTGIQISGGSRNKIQKNDAHGNDVGILLGGSGDTASENNSHSNLLIGISVDGGNNKIKKNQISRQNTGIAINPGADGNLVDDNNITDNGAVGVFVQDADNNEISNNFISNSFSGGVRILSGKDSVVRRNTFSNNADQIFDTGVDTIVKDNNCHPLDLLPPCN